MHRLIAACFGTAFPVPPPSNDCGPYHHWVTTTDDGPDWLFEISLTAPHPWFRITHLPSDYVSYWEQVDTKKHPIHRGLCSQNGTDVPPTIYHTVMFMHQVFMLKCLAAEMPRKS